MQNTVLTLAAILALGPLVGAIAGALIRPTSGFLCAGFAFAAGVMVSISFMDLLPQSMEYLSVPWVVGSFVSGFAIMAVLDKALPHFHTITDSDEKPNLNRTALTLVVGIALHNLPEGFAVGATFSSMADLGLVVAIAIACHDVPETIVPVAASLATGRSRLRALGIGGMVTVPTLIGFAVAIVLAEHVSDAAIAASLAVTAGIMIYISGDELIPASVSFNLTHIATFSLAAGMVFVISMKYFI